MIGLPTENDKSAMRDVGFTLADEIEEGLIAEPIWRDPLVVGVPAKETLIYSRLLDRLGPGPETMRSGPQRW
jgi:hypothetical protein